MSYNPYFKVTNGKLDLDIKKLETDIVRPTGTGIQLNHDGSFSLNNSITNLITVGAVSGLQIIGGQLIVNEHTLPRNMIKLNSNSTITRDNNKLLRV